VSIAASDVDAELSCPPPEAEIDGITPISHDEATHAARKAEEEIVTREEHRTVVTEDPMRYPGRQVASEVHDIVEAQPSGGEIARRVTVLAFGIIQVLLVMRIVLLLVAANQAQPLVAGILAFSQLFVAPFEGIMGTDALSSSSSILDVAAIVALIGWSVLEMVILWAVNVFRREPA
jgi:YGGT family